MDANTRLIEKSKSSLLSTNNVEMSVGVPVSNVQSFQKTLSDEESSIDESEFNINRHHT